MKVIYNASAYEAETDESVRDFLHYVFTDDAGEDGFTNRLKAIVEQLKDDEKFRSDYAAMNLHDWDLTQRAKQEGREEGIGEIAVNLLKMNVLSHEQIAQGTGLSLEEIQKIADNLKDTLQSRKK